MKRKFCLINIENEMEVFTMAKINMNELTKAEAYMEELADFELDGNSAAFL